MTSDSYETALIELSEEARNVEILKCEVEETCGFFFSKEIVESHYWSIHQGRTNSNMDQIRQLDSAVMKATSGTDHAKRTEKERSNIERSDMEGKLPADIHSDEIEHGKVA